MNDVVDHDASQDGTAGATTPAVTVENIRKRFGGVEALRGVSLSVFPGEIVGLVGHNGAGKSTLVRILHGDLEPDEGEIRLAGNPVKFASIADALRQGLGVVRQELELVPDLSIAENIYLGDEAAFERLGFLDRRRMCVSAAPLLQRVGLAVDPALRLGALSIGDQQLVAAARALRRAASVLLLDEPTSSLSPHETGRLFEQVRALAQSGIAIIYISHRMDEVAALCHRVVVLRDGQVVGEFADPRRQQHEVISLMAPGNAMATAGAARTRGAPLLELRQLRTGRNGPTDLTLHAGEILGLFGLVGAGRTTMARTVVGDIRRSSGEIVLKGDRIFPAAPDEAYRLGVAYLSESRKTESIFPGRSVRENIGVRVPQRTARYGFVRPGPFAALAGSMIRRLDIRPADPGKPIELLSGGNQQKAVLARLLVDTLDVFILDEPTHGIDILAKQDLLKVLREVSAQGKAVIFVSSELPELMAVSDRILVLRGGQVVLDADPRVVGEREILGAAAGEQEAA
ncbi:MAG TPA: sugar ABC transporter ATP-binding protein [Devosia sp.]|nr:sugar ABC transporter ATP-binding protein [Devosia sp.]